MTRLELRRLAAEMTLDRLNPKIMVDSALKLMGEGVESPSLVQLAGLMNSELSLAPQLFERTLIELQVEIPDKRTASLISAQTIAEGILDQSVPAYAGARAIWRLCLSAEPAELPELDAFIYAASEWDERPEDREMIEGWIQDAARNLVLREIPPGAI